ncbi:aldo/keto reductase [Tenacibaculum tangerinum]|uniref:Aldo/keto reductase n=1 Tax=Tenacibaculum tangerinum TaxID=3038772 RepID=A0ABY8L412_9FLAO|nr:aldo/keto reductase [Tenacibaculum tangerinum]WGH74630.1 aldo/keto reductase [Tenacibaculum tangerinum]
MTNYSNVIAGCMRWGIWGENLDTHQMVNLIEACVQNEVTTFDHADIYGDYTTESSFGKALESSSIKRENIQLISKCGIQHTGNTRTNRIKHYDYSKKYIIWSVEQSLQNLKTEYLDLLLLHRPSPLMHPDEIAAAIETLISQGKIKDFGLSNFTPLQTQLIASKTTVSVNQIEASLSHYTPLLNGDLNYMQLHHIQPMAWSPLGTYFTEDSTKNLQIKEEMLRLTQKYNATETQVLLAWLYQHPSQIIPVIGTTKKERIIEAVAAQKIILETEDWFALLEASQGHKVP